MARFSFLCVLAAVLFPTLAQAEETPAKAEAAGSEFNTEHIFGFAEGSDIGEKGEREIESITIGHFGKIGSYANVDGETSFRYVVTDQLRLSVGTLSDYYDIYNVPGLNDRNSANFSGLITEMRWNIFDRRTSPFGMSLSLNPEWRQLDPISGENRQNYAVPVTLLIDKEVIPSKFFAAVNFAYTPSLLRATAGWEHDDALTAIASGAYAIMPNILIGAEIRHENLAVDGIFNEHALFVGPSLFYRISETMSAKLAWAAQIPDIGTTTLDLGAYERHQVQLQFVSSF
jgi:hypothetical protein